MVPHGRQEHSATETTPCGSWGTVPIEHGALSDPVAAVISMAFKPFTHYVARNPEIFQHSPQEAAGFCSHKADTNEKQTSSLILWVVECSVN